MEQNKVRVRARVALTSVWCWVKLFAPASCLMVLSIQETDCLQVPKECFQGHVLGENVCSVLICSDLVNL